jgi:glyceraldehyde-3-phosphate dehydrogenase/erythrose-4-phosphate dehydrogenase
MAFHVPTPNISVVHLIARLEKKMYVNHIFIFIDKSSAHLYNIEKSFHYSE